MRNFNKIIVTGDVLRPTENSLASSQNINIDWMYQLLVYQLKSASGCEVEKLTWSWGGFDTPLFYKLQGLKPVLQDWVILQNSSIISDSALEYIYDQFKDSCVIGFELPRIITSALDKLDIPYVDLIIHPIRYLSDIFFGVTTNITSMWGKINLWACNENIFYESAGYHKAMISRQRDFKLPERSLLIVGQTEVDRSKVDSGTIVTFSDYMDILCSEIEQVDHVFYKPHPYALNPQYELKLLESLTKVNVLPNNIYQLLGQQNLLKVVSLSSSVIFEARYWLKQSRYLFKNPFLLLEDCKSIEEAKHKKAFNPVLNGVTTIEFWEALFSSNEPDLTEKDSILQPDRLRISLGSSWGYDFLKGS